jgi:hypothetical protein
VADALSGLIVFDVTAVEMAAEPYVFLVAGQGDRDPVSWPQSMLAGGAASQPGVAQLRTRNFGLGWQVVICGPDLLPVMTNTLSPTTMCSSTA